LKTGNHRLADSNPGFASQIAKMDFRQGSETKERIVKERRHSLLANSKMPRS